MKLEVGMYVRSKINGMIGKITDIENIEVLNEKREVLIRGEKRYILDNNYNRGFCETEKDSVKASHNIIDLIEEKDVISFEFYGIETTSEVYKNEDGILTIGEESDGDTITLNDLNIKSIVTKEQFESMAYKVVEE